MVTQKRLLLRVVEPVAKVTERKEVLAPRVPTLSGKVIGYLKGAGMLDFWHRLDELLREKCQPADTFLKNKPVYNFVATKEEIDELNSKCDAVITGVGL